MKSGLSLALLVAFPSRRSFSWGVAVNFMVAGSFTLAARGFFVLLTIACYLDDEVRARKGRGRGGEASWSPQLEGEGERGDIWRLLLG